LDGDSPSSTPSADAVRVLIIADDPLARAGLSVLLTEQPGCQIVGRVGLEDDVSAAVAVYGPDVLLWDLGWGDATRALEILADLNLVSAVLLPGDGGSTTQAAEVWAAGARGLLARRVEPARLVAALRAIAQRFVVFDPSLGGALLSVRMAEPAMPVEALTPRELEVLQLMAEGLANKAIARRLSISEHTVKFHVNAVLGKLNTQSRTEAVVRATRLGLIIL